MGKISLAEFEKANQALQDARNDEKKASTNIIPAGSQEDNEKMYVNEEKLKEIVKESLIEVIVDKIVNENSPIAVDVDEEDEDMGTISENSEDSNWDLITKTRGPWIIEFTGAPSDERYWIKNIHIGPGPQYNPELGSIEEATAITDPLTAYSIASRYELAQLRLESDIRK